MLRVPVWVDLLPHCGLYAYACAGLSTGGNADWEWQACFGTGGSAAQMSSAVHIVGENEGCSWHRPVAAGCQGNQIMGGRCIAARCRRM